MEERNSRGKFLQRDGWPIVFKPILYIVVFLERLAALVELEMKFEKKKKKKSITWRGQPAGPRKEEDKNKYNKKRWKERDTRQSNIAGR